MSRETSRKSPRQESLFRELRSFAERCGIEVRCEKLPRDFGYRVRSGGCLVRGRKWVIVDRTLPAGERLDLLAAELRESMDRNLEIPTDLQPFLQDTSRN